MDNIISFEEVKRRAEVIRKRRAERRKEEQHAAQEQSIAWFLEETFKPKKPPCA